jgi:hypothetical protein
MNMYTTPDQNTVVVWPDEQAPTLLEARRVFSTVSCAGCLLRFNTHDLCNYAACAPPRRRDGHVVIFTPHERTPT